MMEAFQIIANLAILGVLAWWLLREKKREVSREEFESLASDLKVEIAVSNRLIDEHSDSLEAIRKLFRALNDTVNGIRSDVAMNKATGGEIAEAIKTGAAMADHHISTGVKLVLDVMALEGKLPPANYEPPKEAVNLDEDEYSFAPPVTTAMPDIIMARNEKHAEQIGDRVLEELMRGIK